MPRAMIPRFDTAVAEALELRSERGTSVAEMLVVLTILLLVLFMALPNHGEMRSSFGRGTAIQMVDSDLRRARAEAIAQGARTILSVNDDGESYSVGIDRAPYSDPPAADNTLFRTTLPTRITLNASSTVIFDSRGFSVDVDGELQQVVTNLQDQGTSYSTGTLFPTGFVDYQ